MCLEQTCSIVGGTKMRVGGAMPMWTGHDPFGWALALSFERRCFLCRGAILEFDLRPVVNHNSSSG